VWRDEPWAPQARCTSMSSIHEHGPPTAASGPATGAMPLPVRRAAAPPRLMPPASALPPLPLVPLTASCRLCPRCRLCPLCLSLRCLCVCLSAFDCDCRALPTVSSSVCVRVLPWGVVARCLVDRISPYPGGWCRWVCGWLGGASALAPFPLHSCRLPVGTVPPGRPPPRCRVMLCYRSVVCPGSSPPGGGVRQAEGEN
jgi:hypothetical protein